MPFNFSEKEKYEMWCMEHHFKQGIPVADVPHLFIDDDEILAMLQDKADRYKDAYHGY